MDEGLDRCNAEQLLNWMGGAVIRRMDGFPNGEIALDGSVRIAGFDERWNLELLECQSVCRVEQMKRNAVHLFAVDQRRSELHFAVRQISEYATNISGKVFCFGANVKANVWSADMYSLKPLLKKAEESGSVTLKEAYCMAQPLVEQVWRQTVGAARQGKAMWNQEECLSALKEMEEKLGAETGRVFSQFGLAHDRKMRIQGISALMMIQE